MEKEMRVLYIDGVAICSMALSRASAAREGGGAALQGALDRGHSLALDSGWHEVTDTVLTWLKEHSL
jgi:hypothetical protein